MNEYIVSVMALDRPGIVAAVSGAISRAGGNITHLSETILRGYFTIILSVEGPSTLTSNAIKADVESAGADGEFQVGVLPFHPTATVKMQNYAERFVLTMRCKDRKGVINHISHMLAQHGINIDDFYAYVVQGELIMVLEIGVTQGSDLAAITNEIQDFANESGISASLQHEDIFRATTELQAVLRLGDRK